MEVSSDWSPLLNMLPNRLTTSAICFCINSSMPTRTAMAVVAAFVSGDCGDFCGEFMPARTRAIIGRKAAGVETGLPLGESVDFGVRISISGGTSIWSALKEDDRGDSCCDSATTTKNHARKHINCRTQHRQTSMRRLQDMLENIRQPCERKLPRNSLMSDSASE